MARIALVLLLPLFLSSCLAAAAVGAAGSVVGGTISAAGSVAGAGIDAVTPGDDEQEDEKDD